MTDPGPGIIIRKTGFLRQVEQEFSSIFWQIIGIFADSPMFHSIYSALHFQKSSNMAKIWQKMKKSLVQLPPFLHGTSKTQNPGFDFRVPDLSLIVCKSLCTI